MKIPLRPRLARNFEHARFTFIAASCAVLLCSPVSAEILRWDIDPATPGAQWGDGDWDGGSFWLNSGGFNQTWVDGSDAMISSQAVIAADGIVVDDITIDGVSVSLIAGTSGGVLTLGGGEGEHVFFGVSEQRLNIGLPIAGTGGVKSELGVLRLTAVNTYSGDTVVSRGTLEVDGGDAIPNGSTIVLNTSARLNLEANETIGGLSGPGGSIHLPSSGILTIGANGNSTTFGGTFQGSGSSVLKIGAGTLTLNGKHSTSFMPSISVIEGTLVTAHSQSAFGGISVSAGAVLELAENVTIGGLGAAGDVRLNSKNLTVGGGGISGVISGAGSLNVSGSLALTGMNTFSGGITLSGSGAVLSLPRMGTPGLPGPLGVSNSPIAMIGTDAIAPSTLRYTGSSGEVLEHGLAVTGGGAIDVSVAGGILTAVGMISGSGSLVKHGLGTLVLENKNNSFGGEFLLYTGTLSVSEVANAGINSPMGAGDKVTFLTSGSHQESPGRLLISQPGIHSTNRTFNFANGGVVEISEGASLTLTAPVTGGTLRKSGLGTLYLTAANTHTSETRVEQGVLAISGGNAIPNTGAVEIQTNAMLELLPGADETSGLLRGDGILNLSGQQLTLDGLNQSSNFGGRIVGGGQSRIEKRGSGTQAFTNPDSSFSGGVNVAEGAVAVPFLRNKGTNSPLGSGDSIALGNALNQGRLIVTGASAGATNRSITLGAAGGAIDVVDEAAELVLTGPVSGNGTLLKLGSGRLRFGSSFSGPIMVENGVFTPEVDIPGQVTVTNDGVVASTGGPTGTFRQLVLAGGILAPGGDGDAGIMTVDELVVDAGTFSLDLGSAAANGYDQLVLTNGLEIGSPIDLSFNLHYDPVDRVDVFRIVTSDILTVRNGTQGGFRYGTNLLEEGEEFLVTDGQYTQYLGIRYNPDGEGGAEIFAAPEPGTSLLLLGGWLCVAARRRRNVGRCFAGEQE